MVVFLLTWMSFPPVRRTRCLYSLHYNGGLWSSHGLEVGLSSSLKPLGERSLGSELLGSELHGPIVCAKLTSSGRILFDHKNHNVLHRV